MRLRNFSTLEKETFPYFGIFSAVGKLFHCWETFSCSGDLSVLYSMKNFSPVEKLFYHAIGLKILEGFHSHPIFVAALSPLFLKAEIKYISKVTDAFYLFLWPLKLRFFQSSLIHWLYVIIMSRMHFRKNLHFLVAWMSNSLELLAQNRHNIWSLSDQTGQWQIFTLLAAFLKAVIYIKQC